jgi:hypothetical protein
MTNSQSFAITPDKNDASRRTIFPRTRGRIHQSPPIAYAAESKSRGTAALVSPDNGAVESGTAASSEVASCLSASKSSQQPTTRNVSDDSSTSRLVATNHVPLKHCCAVVAEMIPDRQLVLRTNNSKKPDVAVKPCSILRPPKMALAARPIRLTGDSYGTTVEESSSTAEESSCASSDSFADKIRSVVRFDPLVWVHCFERHVETDRMWYGAQELTAFSDCAMKCILDYERRHKKDNAHATAATRRSAAKNNQQVLYTHPALQLEDSTDCADLARQHVRRILLVDPHDLCLQLLEKTFCALFAHGPTIVKVTSSSAALLQCNSTHTNDFDIIVVEERLKLFHLKARRGASGSALLRELATKCPRAILVGVSAHKQDEVRLQAVADLVWSNKTPAGCTTAIAQETIVRALIHKRETLKQTNSKTNKATKLG